MWRAIGGKLRRAALARPHPHHLLSNLSINRKREIMGNNAVHVNPSNIPITINEKGSDWLWAVFAVMLVTDLGVLAWMFSRPRGRRVFHQLALVILTTAAIAYFAMASNLGATGIRTQFRGGGRARAIWYVRYIDWVITTPCLLLELLFTTGLPLGDIITLVFFDLVMIVTGLVGALVASSYKWGFFAFGCAALIYIWFVLLGPARASSLSLGPEYHRTYIRSAAFLSFIWLLYPIAWGLSDGGNRISPDGEMIFYGILDLLAKPVFILYHLWAVSRLDYTRLQLQSGKFSETAQNVAAVDAEKRSGVEAGTAAPKRNSFFNRGHNHASPAAGDTAGQPRLSGATQVAHE